MWTSNVIVIKDFEYTDPDMNQVKVEKGACGVMYAREVSSVKTNIRGEYSEEVGSSLFIEFSSRGGAHIEVNIEELNDVYDYMISDPVTPIESRFLDESNSVIVSGDVEFIQYAAAKISIADHYPLEKYFNFGKAAYVYDLSRKKDPKAFYTIYSSYKQAALEIEAFEIVAELEKEKDSFSILYRGRPEGPGKFDRSMYPWMYEHDREQSSIPQLSENAKNLNQVIADLARISSELSDYDRVLIQQIEDKISKLKNLQ